MMLFKKERKRKMILKELKIEAWSGDATNCYIVEDEKTKETIPRFWGFPGILEYMSL